MKENLINVSFNRLPIIKIRVIDKNDDKLTKKSKKKYPFQLQNDIVVTVLTNLRKFSFKIKANYISNGADIPKPLWWIGSSKDNAFLIASLVHDYMLEYKKYILKEVLEDKMESKVFRHLTSMIFKQILQDSDVCSLKASIMSFFVDLYQATINKNAWDI